MAYNTRDLKVRILGDASGFINASEKVQDETKKTSSGLEDFANVSKKASLVLAGVGVGLTAYAKSATDYTVGLVKSSKELSRQTGASVEDSSRLLYAVQRLGISADQASTVFGIFSKQIRDSQNAVDPTTSKLGALGVNVRNADGSFKNFNEVLLDTADKFAGMKDGSAKTAAAMDLFGRSGKDMIPILNKGSKGIEELEKKADELGLTLDAKTVASVNRYIQSQKDLKDSTNALKVQVGSLTAPVLANFNNRLNNIVSSLLSTNNPLRGMIVNVLAFGGPIAGAASGLAGFAGNIASVASAAGGFRAMMGGITAFMTGPWGLAIGAAVLAIGGLTWFFTRHKKASDDVTQSTQQQTTAEDELNEQMRQLAINTDRAAQITQTLVSAQFEAEGAALGVERAQRAYNDAVKENGANSLEAREALHNLKEAQNRLKEATEKANVAQDNQNLSNGILKTDTPSVINSIQLRIDKFAGLAGTLSSANGQLAVLDANIQSKAPVLQGSVNTLQGSVQRLQGSIQNLQGTKINLQGGTIQLQGARASGGPVQAGKSYLVGEEGMEIFTPDTSGRIIPNDKVRSGVVSTATEVTQPVQQTIVNFDPTFQIGMYAGMPTEYRELAERMWVEFQRIAQSNGIKLQTIGARSQ